MIRGLHRMNFSKTASSCFMYLAISIGLISGPSFAKTGEEIEEMITAQFLLYDPDYRTHRDHYTRKLEEMAQAVAEAEGDGHSLYCSQQLYLEAKWLLQYTAHWDKLQDKLARIQASLAIKDQSFAARQSPVDGHWGVCHEEKFMRLAATIEGLAKLDLNGEKPHFGILAIAGIETGKQLIDRLTFLLTSDIANEGTDNRAELGSLTTSMALAAFKPDLRSLFVESVDLKEAEGVMDRLTEAFRFFLDGSQDHKTGYWGAWYVVDGKIIKTADLSFTYHIVGYTKGNVERLPQILSTTAAIENEPYPYGWKHNGRDNNHNLYDVAKIYKYGWPHVPESERPALRRKISEMIDWSLKNTLNDAGQFKFDPSFSNSLGAEFYFGVSFLDVVGLWDKDLRFWTEDDVYPDAKKLCHRIKDALTEVGVSGWQAEAARQKLNRNC